ncbi:hypothetical protein ACFY5J_27025 [Peribacillus butanolivorans]|uniref:hypothetical protein n=1 Tax=Peribacillus butanolivorans TaxID=421767 RepID=UPI0036CE8303
MEKIDFNSGGFTGFSNGEDLLLDTGIVLAYLNSYDSWHNTVKNFFDTEITGKDLSLYLYVTQNIVNEITHLVGKPVEKYLRKYPSVTLSPSQIQRIETSTIDVLEHMIEVDLLNVLGGNKQAVLNQISLYKALGASDAANVALANEFGLNLLTVDGRLASNMEANKSSLPNIEKVYFTTGTHRSY